MAIQFPNSPNNGDQHTEAGLTYTFDGEKWVTEGYSPAFVKKDGDTMTGALTVPDATVTGVIDNPGIARAWGYVNSTVKKGFNVNIGTISKPSLGHYEIKFITPMADANYAVLITPGQMEAQVPTSAMETARTRDGFTVFTQRTNTGAFIWQSFNFVVYA